MLAKQSNNDQQVTWCMAPEDETAQSSPAISLLWGGSELTKKVVLATVTRSGMALKHARAQLQGDREFVLAVVTRSRSRSSVRSRSRALQYASSQLKADKEVVLAAVARNGGALVRVPAGVHLRADKEVVDVALSSKEDLEEVADVASSSEDDLEPSFLSDLQMERRCPNVPAVVSQMGAACAKRPRLGINLQMHQQASSSSAAVEDMSCPICKEFVPKARCMSSSSCSHVFCRDCIQKWVGKCSKCPLCKREMGTLVSMNPRARKKDQRSTKVNIKSFDVDGEEEWVEERRC